MATVVVTDGEERAALAAVRSLGRAGHAVVVCSSTGRSLAGASRHARADHRVGRPGADPEVWADAVRAVGSASSAEVVLPVTDAAVLALLPARERLGEAVVPYGDLEAFRALSDKGRVAALARDSGIAVPEQRVVSAPGEAEGVDLGWPVVVKPARSVTAAGGGLRKNPVGYASSAGELRDRLDGLPASAFPVLLQRRIEGVGTGVFLLRWEGETRALFAHRRLREKPPSGGVSVYRESVAADPELVRRCERLLEAVGWRGAAMVEFRREAGTGTPYLMEVNARLWGSLQLAVDAGVDFPRLLVEAALGAPAGPVPAYREGVRSRWWWGDVDHLIARLRTGGEEATDPGEGGRIRALGAFLVPWRPGDRFEVLRLGDLGPFVRESGAWLRAAAGRRGAA